MKHNFDFSTSTSTTIAAELCKRLENIRLSKNVNQSELSEQAGVSRSTLTRIAKGQSISLDSFIRVLKALGLAGHLTSLLPDPDIRPVEMVRQEGRHRRRASTKRKATEPWSWADDGDEN